MGSVIFIFPSIHSEDIQPHPSARISTAADGKIVTDWNYVTVDLQAAEERSLNEIKKNIRRNSEPFV